MKILSDFRPLTHWLRHTFIRLSRRAGRDIKFVQQNTGDSLKTILEHYEGLTDEVTNLNFHSLFSFFEPGLRFNSCHMRSSYIIRFILPRY